MPEANIETKSIEGTDTRKTFPQLFAHFLIPFWVSSKRILRDNIFWIHFEIFCYFYFKKWKPKKFWKNLGCFAYIYTKYQIPIYSQTKTKLDGLQNG